MTATVDNPIAEYQGRRALWTLTERADDETVEGVSPMVAHLLHHRGYVTPDDIRSFFSGPGPEHDPYSLPDMREAVARITAALAKSEEIAVYGDFDCDGLTASATILETLRLLGGDPRVVIPTRDEGHGMRENRLEELAAMGVKLVISADCGITDIAAVSHARARGLDVIVTDHHQPSADGSLPDALVVSPTRADSHYPWPGLSGAGVAYKLAQALLQTPDRYEALLDLVALGTVADVVSLRDENRTLVIKGIGRLKATVRCGLRALYGVAGVDSRRIDSTSIGYYLGPRINVANRLADPRTAFDLITATDPVVAHQLAQELDGHNSTRQEIVERKVEELLAEIGPAGQVTLDIEEGRRPPIMCVFGEWVPGVSGLIASELAETYSVPAIAARSNGDGTVVASGRSVDDVNILALLQQTDAALPGCFLAYGGHSGACGFSASAELLPAIFDRLEAISRSTVSLEGLGSRIMVDAQVKLSQLSLSALSQVESLGPFGRDFPEPAFLARGIYLQRRQPIGSGGKHLKASACSGNTRVSAIIFGCDPELAAFPEDQPLDVVFNLSRDEWDGSTRPQINIRDWRPFV